MLNQSFVRRIVHVLATVLVISLLAAAARDARAQFVRIVTWGGGHSNFWDDDLNWGDNIPDNGPLQPFDPDSVIIPSGTPEIRFIEGINTLDVDAGAGIADNSVLSVHNGVVNDGLITLGPDGQLIMDNGMLAGGGAIVLTDNTGTNASFQGAPFGHTPCCVTHAATHTIRGEGTVSGKLVNDGLIRAEEASGDMAAVLTILGQTTNNGVIRSSASGSILLNGALTIGATGQVIADAQPIQLGGATITSGALDAVNGGKYVFVSNPVTLSGVTLNADLEAITAGGTLVAAGSGITNNATITLDNHDVSEVVLSGNAGATLSGTGTVVLNRGNNGTRINGTLTNGASHTIRGVGLIQATLVNNGSIFAEPKNGGALLRVVASPITNNGLLQANNGATLRFEQQATVTQNAAGRIRAANGGTVELKEGINVIGGKLQTEGTGVIVNTGSSTLTDVTNEGAFHVPGETVARVKGTSLTNNGVITVNPTGGANFFATNLEFGSNVTIGGTGSIVLNQTNNNARITFLSGTEIITQAAGHTIRGKGLIDNAFGSGRVINHGRLEGASAAEPLVLFTDVSGEGVLRNVLIGGHFILQQHILAEAGTTAIVPAEGLYALGNASSLLVDLAGTTPGTGYDQLNSTGPITLTSTTTRLEVSLAGGFMPKPGDSFKLLTTTDALTGNFGTVVLPTVPEGLSWTQQQTANSFSITLTGSLAADFDNDGDVDSADLAQWGDDFGRTGGATKAQGNADADADVDGADFLTWQRQFGLDITPAVATATPIPEPSSIWLTTLAAASIVMRRGHRGRRARAVDALRSLHLE